MFPTLITGEFLASSSASEHPKIDSVFFSVRVAACSSDATGVSDAPQFCRVELHRTNSTFRVSSCELRRVLVSDSEEIQLQKPFGASTRVLK